MAALSANFDIMTPGLLKAAMFEGWSRSESIHAIDELRQSKATGQS